MTYKTFKLYRTLMTMAIAASVAGAVVAGNALVPIPVVIAGSAIMYLAKRRVKEVIEDERVFRIAERASRITMGTCAILMAVVGATLIALSRNGAVETGAVGYTLAYSACALLMVYNILYAYYSHKLGGAG